LPFEAITDTGIASATESATDRWRPDDRIVAEAVTLRVGAGAIATRRNQ
jgi:hypothetical protein